MKVGPWQQCAALGVLAAALAGFALPSTSRPEVASTAAVEGTGSMTGVDVELEPGWRPEWADAEPSVTYTLTYDPIRSPVQNGQALEAMTQILEPGDRLVVGGGRWVVDRWFNVSLAGTRDHPIWIEAAEGERPVVTRSDASQNVINVGTPSMGPARYLCLRGLEITGGSIGLRLHDCEQVWVDRCEIHHTADAALTANTAHTSQLFITRNHIHDTAGTGEGMYLGANYGEWIMAQSVIAANRVHDCGGEQGDGIEVKQGSWGNLIVANDVRDCHYPCILVYGTDGLPPNRIERNVCIGSGDNVVQVQGEAIVSNNLIIGGQAGLASHDHQGTTSDLHVVHNTILNTGPATQLSHWGGRPNMVFANNIVYSRDGGSIVFGRGASGVAIEGNVVLGPVTGVAPDGYVLGRGLEDFVDADFSGEHSDVSLAPDSPAIGFGATAYGVDLDLQGLPRSAPYDAGCRVHDG